MDEPTTVREYLNALGYKSGDHDTDVRNALHELYEHLQYEKTLEEEPDFYYPRPTEESR